MSKKALYVLVVFLVVILLVWLMLPSKNKTEYRPIATESSERSQFSADKKNNQERPKHDNNGMPIYAKNSAVVGGNLVSVGSDTLANLMTLWSEKFREVYPSVNFQIQAAGSSTAPPALIESVSHFGPMSRKMKRKEVDGFVKKFGYEPIEVPVALDGLALYVNAENSVKKLTIQEIDAIFSSTNKCGYTKSISRWSDLGADNKNKIELFGRNSVSGTYGYFKSVALCKGDYRPTVNEQPGSAAVVQAVAQNSNAIGYSGMGYKLSGIRALSVAKSSNTTHALPTEQNILSGKYPLSRFLYIYVNKHPNRPLDLNISEFLKMVLSDKGQAVVKKDGFVSLSPALVKKYRAMLELD